MDGGSETNSRAYSNGISHPVITWIPFPSQILIHTKQNESFKIQFMHYSSKIVDRLWVSKRMAKLSYINNKVIYFKLDIIIRINVNIIFNFINLIYIIN